MYPKLRPCAGLALLVVSAAAMADAVGTTEGLFEVTPSGVAKYSVPITVPPGTAGLQPRLAVQYASGAKNGPLGVGFTLTGLSQISRCPSNPNQDGIDYDPVDFDAADRFCLDGKRLVSANHGGLGAEYRTELESFLQVKSVGNVIGSAGDPDYFVVRTKGRVEMLYGATADSRITLTRDSGIPCRLNAQNACMPDPASHAYRWLLSRVTDGAGNYFEIHYVDSVSNGEVLPDEILYTGNVAAGISVTGKGKIKFNYQNRLGMQQLGHWTGQSIASTKLLQNIETYFGSQLLRRYNLTYQVLGAAGREYLQTIQECAEVTCLPATSFAWEPLTEGMEDQQTVTPTNLSNTAKQHVGDWDGNGRQDIIALVHDTALTANVLQFQPDGSYVSSAYSLQNAPSNTGDWIPVVADINADGRSDVELLRLQSGTLESYVWTVNAQGNITSRIGLSTKGIQYAGTKTFVADVDRDGAKEIVLIHASTTNGVQIQTFRHLTSPTGNVLPNLGIRTFETSLGEDYDSYVGDVNGDGLADVILVHQSSTKGAILRTYLSDGAGNFTFAGVSRPIPSIGTKYTVLLTDANGDGNGDLILTYAASSSTTANARVLLSSGDGVFFQSFAGAFALNRDAIVPLLGDFNGDGIGDLGWVSGTDLAAGGFGTACAISVFYGTPTGTLVAGPVTNRSTCGTWHKVVTRWIAADVNADSKTDWIVSNVGAGANGGAASTYVYRAMQGPPGWLTRVTDGYGAQTNVVYKALTDAATYSVTAPCGGYPVRIQCGALRVVSEVWRPDSPRVTYSYKDLQVEPWGRGALGPAEVTEFDVTRGIKARTTYRQDFPYVGLPASSSTELSSGSTIGSSSYVYDSKTLVEGTRTSWFPFAKLVTTSQYEIPPFARLALTETTDSSYDDFGNRVSVVRSLVPGPGFASPAITERTDDAYTNDAVLWRFDLTMRTVLRQRGADASKTRTTAYRYDAGTGLLDQIVVEPNSATLRLQTDYSRDVLGNITTTKVAGAGVQTRLTCDSWEEAYPYYGRFNTRTVRRLSGTDCASTSPADHVYSRSFDAGHGRVTAVVDPNNLSYGYSYDAFGRPFRKSFAAQPIDAWAQLDWMSCDRTLGCDTRLGDAYLIRASASDDSTTIFVFDRLQRQTSHVVKLGDGHLASIRTTFDSRGYVSQTSAPQILDGGGPVQQYDYWTTFTRDAMGRVLEENAPVSQDVPSGRRTRYEYDGLVSRLFDANNNQATREIDGAGNLISGIDAANATPSVVTYAYDAFDHISRVVDAGQAVKTLEHDLYGRKLSMTDPDMGQWQYAYNALGEVVHQVDAKSQSTDFVYDALGRLVQRNEQEGLTTWTFDVSRKDALEEVTGPGYRRSYAYFPHGGVDRETIEIAAMAAPPGPPAVLQFAASPSSLMQGNNTTLSWATENAEACTASGNLPGWSGNKAGTGSQTLPMMSAGTFEARLSCVGRYGESALRSITVAVQPAPQVRITNFRATPNPADEGEAMQVTWATENAVVCSASGSLPGWSGSKPVSGSQWLSVDEPGDYQATLTCRDTVNRTAEWQLPIRVNDCLVPLQECVKSPVPLPVTSPLPDPNEVPALPPDPIGTVVAAICGLDPRLCGAPPDDPVGAVLTALCGLDGRLCDPASDPVRTVLDALCIQDPWLCNPGPPPLPQDPVDGARDLLCTQNALLCDPQPPPVPSDPIGQITATLCALNPVLCDPQPPPVPQDPIGTVRDVLCTSHPLLCNPQPPPIPQDPVGTVRAALCALNATLCDPPQPREIVETARDIVEQICDLDDINSCTTLSMQDIERTVQMIRDLSRDPCGAYTGPFSISLNTQPVCDSLPPAPCLVCGNVTPQSELADGSAAYSYTYQYTYDTAGRVQDLTYPSGLKIRNAYANGVLASVSNADTGLAYWSAQGWDNWGNADQVQFGNGVHTQRAYDVAVGDLRNIYTGLGGGSAIQNLRYSWDAVGNLQERADDNRVLAESFGYNDSLYRLMSATGPGGQSLSVSYQPNGNIQSKSDIGIYSYGAKPHAVAGAGGQAYLYDPNGNLTGGGGRSYSWTSYNLPSRIDKDRTHADFLYGPERQRIRQLYETPTEGKLIYYAGRVFEEHRRGSTIESKHMIEAADGVVAIVTRSNAAAEKTEYLHKDHLGSVDVVTDEGGEVKQCLSYDAFGKRRTCATWQGTQVTALLTTLGFTGHEHLDSVGLVHMNGRVYDPALGRFISADPFVTDPTNSQSHNRYSYTLNNPLKFVDPSGFGEEGYEYIPPSDGYPGAIVLPDPPEWTPAESEVDQGYDFGSGLFSSPWVSSPFDSLTSGGVNLAGVGYTPMSDGGISQSLFADGTLSGFLGDSLVGFGDGVWRAVTFGQGDLEDVRDLFGITQFSGDETVYSGGLTVGSIHGGLTLGGAVGLFGKGKSGFEFSHAIAARNLRSLFGLTRSAEARLSRLFGNGMYVPKWFHAWTDAYRFTGGWALPKLPAFLAAPLRVPAWITGGAMGYCTGDQC